MGLTAQKVQVGENKARDQTLSNSHIWICQTRIFGNMGVREHSGIKTNISIQELLNEDSSTVEPPIADTLFRVLTQQKK